MELFQYRQRGGGLLNAVKAMETCRPILEGLSHLTISSFRMNAFLLTADQPAIKFRNLTSLRLVNTVVDGDAWKRFMTGIRVTVESLEADNFGCYDDTPEYVMLPFPLLNLKKFEAIGHCFTPTPPETGIRPFGTGHFAG